MNGMLCCIFNYAPLYRQAIYSEIDREFDTQFCFGEEVIDGQGDTGIKQLDKTAFRHPVKKIRNKMLLGRHPWRSGILSLPFKKAYSTFLITGDLNWAYIPFLQLCRFLGKRVYGWGHGVKTMQGQTHFKRWFYNHLDGYFIYGEKGRERMRELGFDVEKIYVIYNSLTYSLADADDSESNSTGENENEKLGKVENEKFIEWKNKNSGRGEGVMFEDGKNGKMKEGESNGRNVYREHFSNSDPTIIFSGRLTPAKRVEMLLNAFIRLNGEGVKCNLVIIGDGPERKRLEELSVSNQKPYTNNIHSQSAAQIGEYQPSESGTSCMKNTDSQSGTQKREYQPSESGASCVKNQESREIQTENGEEATGNSSQVADRVWFYGECYDEERTAELLRDATVCVSPGNVGLMAIHAMQCGTPVISHSNFETQMPEYEVIVEENPNDDEGDCVEKVETTRGNEEKNGGSRPTGALFKEGDEDDLCRVLRDWLTKHSDDREQIRENCREMIESHWTAKTQIAILKSVLK